MLQDEQDVGNEETYFRIKNLLSWKNNLRNRQFAADRRKMETMSQSHKQSAT